MSAETNLGKPFRVVHARAGAHFDDVVAECSRRGFDFFTFNGKLFRVHTGDAWQVGTFDREQRPPRRRDCTTDCCGRSHLSLPRCGDCPCPPESSHGG